MAVAENRLSFHLLREKLSDPKYRQLTDSTGSYDNMRGRLRLRTAFAQLMEQNVTAGATVHPDQLVISAGAGQIISSLSYLLLDPNDSIMLFTPTCTYTVHFRRCLGLVCSIPRPSLIMNHKSISSPRWRPL